MVLERHCQPGRVARADFASPATQMFLNIPSRPVAFEPLLTLNLHYKRGRHAVEMPRMGYQRGPHKQDGYGPCCASRNYVFTAKHRRASPVRATKSAASLLCCCEKGGGGGQPPLSKSAPPRLSDTPRTRMTCALPAAVCMGHPVAVETRAAPAKANPHASISSRFVALTHPPGRARPGQVSCRTLAFS